MKFPSMLKPTLIGTVLAAALLAGCSDVRREPGSIYMPDMAYSRAYETYAPQDNLAEKGINYNSTPVTGTVSRGETYVWHIAKDAAGDTANYNASRAIENPVKSLTQEEWTETERQYLINCGICHGAKLDGNGPLWKDGEGPYPAAPKNLVADAGMQAMPDGQMFYSITYGKNLMGGYASQVKPEMRWKIIHYIKAKQKGQEGPAAAAPTPAAAPETAPM